ncbi:dihydrolipoamide acetyltransferase family protein [Pimelobacter simplex]|uniref:dihydrolipoamide acetyltransferase family protein n=1 Tax=Nocardioides simplex TaxID=2045 RepID=UPI001932AA8B|nr:2-oxo acid dehydrogenase subunit E2 [Pimelobacter simplex]
MATITRMPELAANTPDATLTEWLVKEGDSVSAGDPIATVETAKATVDIEAEIGGVVLRLVVEDGAEVLVGAPILVIGSQDEDISSLDLGDGPGADEPNNGPAENAAPFSRTTPNTPAPAPVPDVVQAEVKVDRRPAAEEEPLRRVFASPLARKIARDSDIQLTDVTGTGPNGRIVRRDVVAALVEPPKPVAREPEEQEVPRQGRAGIPEAGYVETPHTRLRRAIATRLTQSKRDAPHFYVRGTAEVTELLALRRRLVHDAGVQISVNDLLVKAVALTHVRNPKMNCIWTDDAIRTFDNVDVAVAVATETGLVTPVVRGVESLSLSALAQKTRDAAAAARAGKLHPNELEGGSVTVSNLGMFGTEEFAAIINPPHASILAVGAAVDAPVVRDGAVVPGKTMTVTLSVDHRAVDGADAAAWMRDFLSLIESPLSVTV